MLTGGVAGFGRWAAVAWFNKSRALRSLSGVKVQTAAGATAGGVDGAGAGITGAIAAGAGVATGEAAAGWAAAALFNSSLALAWPSAVKVGTEERGTRSAPFGAVSDGMKIWFAVVARRNISRAFASVSGVTVGPRGKTVVGGVVGMGMLKGDPAGTTGTDGGGGSKVMD